MSHDLVSRSMGSAASVLAALTVFATAADPMRSAPAVAGFVVGSVWPWTSFGRARSRSSVAILAVSLVLAPAATSWLLSVILAVLAATALFAYVAPTRFAALSGAAAVAVLLGATVLLPGLLAPTSLDPVLPGHAVLLAVAGAALLALVLFLRPEVSS